MRLVCNICGEEFDVGEATDDLVCSCHINPPCAKCEGNCNCPYCSSEDTEEAL